MFHWRPRPFSIFAFALAGAIFSGLLAFAQWQSRDDWAPTPSPALRQFFERCAQVRPDMSDSEIDRLFVDYFGCWSDLTEELRVSAPRVKRPATMVKWYHSVPNANDLKYSIAVYFDKDNHVVGKSIGWSE